MQVMDCMSAGTRSTINASTASRTSLQHRCMDSIHKERHCEECVFFAGHMCGDGLGTATFINFHGPDVKCDADGSPSCTEPIFGHNCTAYDGTIGIWFDTSIRTIPALILEGHLSRLGFSGITHIMEDLLIMMPADGGDRPALALSFFEDLLYIGGNLTVDVNAKGAGSSRNVMSRRFDLSSLWKVSHIGGGLRLRNKRLRDLSMFRALTCVGRAVRSGQINASGLACKSSSNCRAHGRLVLSGNAELQSYNGLQSLISVTRSVSDVSGVALVNISAISRLAHCTNGVPRPTHVKISVAACPGAMLRTWSHVCSYISSRSCPRTQIHPSPSPGPPTWIPPSHGPPGPRPPPPGRRPLSPPPPTTVKVRR